jgi:protein TonB
METRETRFRLERTPLTMPLPSAGGRIGRTAAASIALHVLALGLVLALPLLLDRSLPEASHGTRAFLAAPVLLAPPPPPPPAPARGALPHTVPPVVANDALVAHAEIPTDLVPETSLDLGLEAGVPGGVEGGVPGGVVGGIVGGLPDAPPAPPVKPLLVGGDVQAPRKLRGDPPVYPPAARRSRLEGLVILECVIDERGRVRDARVLRGVPLLDEAALAAVRGWVYTPTLFDGMPVPVQMTVTVAFRLARL